MCNQIATLPNKVQTCNYEVDFLRLEDRRIRNEFVRYGVLLWRFQDTEKIDAAAEGNILNRIHGGM